MMLANQEDFGVCLRSQSQGRVVLLEGGLGLGSSSGTDWAYNHRFW